MKRKSAMIVAILIMCIGFAAISTTLVINGNAKVGENTDDFSVIFTAATLDGQDVYDQVINDTRKIITFETSDLKTLNQTSVLTYEVTNNSSNYDAEVSVNCKVKNDAEAKYTSIKNELENNATVVKAKKTLNGTLTITLNKTATEEVKEEYVCELEFNAMERDELGKGIPDPVSFATDSWETIQKAVRLEDTDLYNIGNTKQVDLGDLGTHTVRIANKSECTNGETSETACGFVVEFADVITNHMVNNTNTNVGGWRDSEMRTYVNETIYDSLPDSLKNVIVLTEVISGHGSTSGEINFQTRDKLYLLSMKEIYGEVISDLLVSETKQLDYYKNIGASLTNYSNISKKIGTNDSWWWLRSAMSTNNSNFLSINSNGKNGDGAPILASGVSPAFRIA